MNRFLTFFLFAFLLLACGSETVPSPSASANGSASPAKVIRVSAIPDENPTELQRKYKPLVDFLEKALGAKVKYLPVTDYGAAVSALASGKIDFAWLGGFTHVQARHQTEVVPLCMRAIDREFKSVFVASVDSGIEKVEDIKGKKFAFGSKSSTSGHLMPRHFLISQFSFNPDKDFDGAPLFSGSHDATIKMVETGKVDAGAANSLVWARLQKQKKVDTSKVKVVWTTPGYVDYVWTARKALSADVRKKFLDAFLALDESKPEDKKVLDLQDAKKFVAAKADDFDAVEKVALSTGLLKKK
jgi:phosphonate transport system substrate-binding protein